MDMSMSIGMRGALPIKEGVGAWAATEASLRALYAANNGLDTPHTLSVMASPPTITDTASTSPPSGMAVTYSYVSGSTVLAYKGGADKTFSTNFRRFPNSTDLSGGGNTGGNESAVDFRISIRTSSPAVAWNILGSGSIGYRFLVRDWGGIDQYVSLTPRVVASNQYIKLDAGSAADRVWTIEGVQNLGFRGVSVNTGYTATNPAEFDGIGLFLGDSFTKGSPGPTTLSDGCMPIAAELLGFANRWASGVGGTGYISTNTGTQQTLGDRLVTDVNRAKASGRVDKVFVAMGVNDHGSGAGLIQAAAHSVFSQLRSLLPAASISVIPSWDTAAPSAPLSDYVTARDEIKAAAAGRGGFKVLDLTGTAFDKYVDGLHPSGAGALTLGQAIAAAERTALAA